jgi:hypothetical protein
VHYQIQGRDEAGNLGSTSVASVVVNQSDVLPPIISLLGATSDGTGTGIVIVWQTNEPADSRVEYGPTNAYGSSTTLDPTLTTSHLVGIGGLTQGQTIHYRAHTRDASGNESMSVDRTFTLNTDTTAPVITLLPITYTASQARFSLQLSEPGFGTIQWGIMSPTEQLQFLGSVDAASTMYEATLPNLLYSVTYQYVIQITDPSGNLASTSGSFLFLGVDGGDTVPPSTPFGVSVADFVPSAGVTLSWAQNSEADLAGYRVYRRVVSGNAATETWTALSGSAAVGAASFTDPTVADDTSYEYTVTAIDQTSNESAPSNAVLFDPSLWGTVTLLSPSSPNPFSLASGTRISFRAPGGSTGERFTTALRVFDVTGRRIRTLFKGELLPGEARVASWDGRDREGREVAAGVYFSMLEVEGAAPTVAKMTLLR